MLSHHEALELARPGAMPDIADATGQRATHYPELGDDLAALLLDSTGTGDTDATLVSIERLDRPDRDGIVAWSWVTWAASAPASDTARVG